jgi:methyltransferase
LALLSAQRLAELAVAEQNTKRLLARGAYEVGADHYPLMIALHSGWLATLWFFGRSHALASAWLTVLIALQLGRWWVMHTLGPCWTTRVIVQPGVPLVATGPYRLTPHPAYTIVAFELPAVSLALGMPWHALAFGAANLLMLHRRVGVENEALKLEWMETAPISRRPQRERDENGCRAPTSGEYRSGDA